MSRLEKYLEKTSAGSRHLPTVAYCAALDHLAIENPSIADAIVQELRDQRSHLKLIASENYSSFAVQLAMGNLLTDKYAEGSPYHRFYAGCGNVDGIEAEGTETLRKLFGADHAYIQPHSGCDANLVAFWAVLVKRYQDKEVEALGKKNIDALTAEEYEKVRQLMVSQKIMGMSLGSGGHLTHGYRHNISSKMMQSVSYDVDATTGLLDYDAIAQQARKEKPAILLAGYSSYPRLINFAKMKDIAERVGAVLIADIAHFAGLVAGKAITGEYNPVPYADIITSTTHKTMRGPRGGFILCTEEFADIVDKGCPLVLGGPLPHVMAAKAVAFREASQPEFCEYASNVIDNAKSLAEGLLEGGAMLLTGGTDNHLVIIDVTKYGITGRHAESALREAGITVNRNSIPSDPNGPWYTSGVRIGTPATTTLGLGAEEMKSIANIIVDVLEATIPEGSSKAKYVISSGVLESANNAVSKMLKNFPLYHDLDISE